MKLETLENAKSIQNEIKRLNEEICVLPKTKHKRSLLRFNKDAKLQKTYDGIFAVSTGYFDNRIIELTDEDLNLFIAIRRHRIEELEMQLELLN